MSQEHLLHTDGSVIIKIDIEDLFHKGHPHPEHDPGTLIIYIYKVDEVRYETRERTMTGRAILEQTGMDVHQFRLFQLKREHGHRHKVEIKLDTVVDFREEGIERFITEPVLYHFYIGQKEYETTDASLTVRQILVDFAKVDPKKNTLAIKTEGGFHEYKNLDEIIQLNDCPHFVLFDNCQTSVS
jgi:hypothetical protein